MRYRTHTALLGLLCGLHLPSFGQTPPGAGPALGPSQESGIGVWYQPGAPSTEKLWREGDPGERLILRGRILDVSGVPLGGARIELWHADALGEVHADRFRTTLHTAADGGFRISTVMPGYIWGPRHIHAVVNHEAHAEFITRLYFRRDPELDGSGHPGVPVFLEDGKLGGKPALFGRVDLVLP